MRLINKIIKPIGVSIDQPPMDVEEDKYTRCENIVFQDDSARTPFALKAITGTIALSIKKIQSVRTPSNYFWLGLDALGAIVMSDAGESDVSPVVPFTGGGVGDWTSVSINNLPIVANGFDAPHYWDQNTVNPMLPLPNFPVNTIPKWVGSFKGFCIVGDIDAAGNDFENQILWSNPVAAGEVPSIWQAAPDNLAGDNVLASTEGAMIFGITLRDQYLLFKTHSIYSMRFSGGVNVFNFQELFSTVGILTRNCAVEYKGFVYLFSDGDLMVTDGFSIESIAERVVREQVFREINNEEFTACFVTKLRVVDEIWFCYPTAGKTICNRAAVYNIQAKAWGFIDLEDITDAQSGLTIDSSGVADTWDNLAFPTWDDWHGQWTKSDLRNIADGLIQVSNLGTTAVLKNTGEAEAVNPTQITSNLVRESMDLDNDSVNKVISEVWLYIDSLSGQSVDVRLGTQQDYDDPITWGNFQPYNHNGGVNTISAHGRYISIEMRIISSGSRTARIRGFRLRYRLAGNH